MALNMVIMPSPIVSRIRCLVTGREQSILLLQK